jgi:hypothetical protein
VWCKCNDTAGHVIPWPVPARDWDDFQSNITLTYLHESQALYGQVPKNERYRDGRNMQHNRGLL